MTTLFDNLPKPAPPSAMLPHNGTATSKAAAKAKAASGSSDLDRNRIAVWLLEHPEGATRDELAAALCIPADSIRPRVYELLGKCQRYLARGGEPVLVEQGTRQWRHHGPSKVLVHRQNVKGGA